MLDKLKQIKELRALQNDLAKEVAEVEKNGVKVALNGKMELVDIKVNKELSEAEQERLIKECFNEAMRKIQMAMAAKMQNMSSMF